VSIENADLSWGFKIKKSEEGKDEVDKDSKDTNLHNISMQVESGQLAAVVGAVGCGKSTLLAGVMHELQVLSGSVRTNGKMAYVEQEPFIVSGTVKENILLGSEYDEKLFKQTIEA
jgi:ABC-type transport system involved in cytochrome bd biosynthesis fused ATPase/permease subunit